MDTKGSERTAASSRFSLLGVTIDNVTRGEAIRLIVEAATSDTRADFAFVNAHCLNEAVRNDGYASVLATMRAVFADGSGVRLAARLRGVKIRGNVNGTDIFPQLCDAVADLGIPLSLFGAAPGRAKEAATRMKAERPSLKIVACHHGFVDAVDEPLVIDAINRSGAKVLLVALGVPRQEMWVANNRSKLTVPVTLGVGALFDFYSGAIPRAPSWLRRLGVEWIWRLALEPGRLWRRYVLGNPAFLCRCLTEQARTPVDHGDGSTGSE